MLPKEQDKETRSRSAVKFTSIGIISACLLACASLSLARGQDSQKVVFWNTSEGQQRFARAEKTDFYGLAQYFEPQLNKFYCAPAAGVIVLNALRVHFPAFEPLPTEPNLFPGSYEKLQAKMPKFDPVFKRYTQNTFFTAATDKVKPRFLVFGEDTESPDYGIQLRQLDGMLRAHGIKTSLVVVNGDTDAQTIRRQFIENLKTSGDFVIVNFARSSLGENGGGHVSPLAAYDAQTDSVLILDVNPTMYSWEWVRIDDLVAAMNTKDVSENRGYILVSEGAK